MNKNLGIIQYNVSEISQMTFEEFRSLHTSWSDNKCKNVYQEITGKKITGIVNKKETAKPPTAINNEVDETKKSKKKTGNSK